MLAVVGTIPDPHLPLLHGPVRLVDGRLQLADQRIPVNRGTPALLAAAIKTTQHLDGPEIHAFLAGDAEAGLQQFIEMLQRDRSYGDGLAKKSLIDAFRVVEDDDLVSRYRRRMSSLLLV